MIKVIIAGAAGRMGQRIGHMVNSHPQLEYAAAFEAQGNPAIGKDAGMLSLGRKMGLSLARDSSRPLKRGCDNRFHFP